MSQAGIFSTGGGGGGGITSVDTDLGTATPVAGVLNIVADNATFHAGSSVSFSGSGNTVLLNVTDSGFNTIIGEGAGSATLSGNDNVVLGQFSVSSLIDASANTVVGSSTLSSLTTGDYNTIIGAVAATSYNGDESSNIIIGRGINGTNGESNTLRIGNGSGTGAGSLSRCFISGIDGVDVGSVATVVTQNNDQLGTATITAGSGITVTPGPNAITISASGGGSTIAFIATVGTTINDVTGDGTNYRVVYDNVIADTNSAYNNTTGVFTTPVTGFYQLSASVCAQGLTAVNDYEIRIDIDDASQELEGPYLAAGLVAAAGGYFNGSVSGLMFLTAGNQVFVNFVSNGGVKDIDVFNVYSWFNGFKVN